MNRFCKTLINTVKKDRINQYKTLRKNGISRYRSEKLIKFTHSFYGELKLAPSKLAYNIYLIKKGRGAKRIVSNLEKALFGFSSDNDL